VGRVRKPAPQAVNNFAAAGSVLAIKLARAVYFMLKAHTVFDPERLVAGLTRN
jgi:hypothetical protein